MNNKRKLFVRLSLIGASLISLASCSLIQKIIKINNIIETVIAPELRKDFGDIELINVENNNVYVKLKGHCSTCANAKMTLKNFVETKLKELIHEEINVLSVEK